MEYKLVVTNNFERDLSAALKYISEVLFSPAAARRLLKTAKIKIANIGENPFMYPKYHDEKISEMGYRYAVCENYLIFYRIEEAEKQIYLLRFLYSAQNITENL